MPNTITISGYADLDAVTKAASEIAGWDESILYLVDAVADETPADLLEHTILDNADHVRIVVVGYVAGFLSDLVIRALERGVLVEMHRNAKLVYQQGFLNPEMGEALAEYCEATEDDPAVVLQSMKNNVRWRSQALAYHFGIPQEKLEAMMSGQSVVVDQHLFSLVSDVSN